MKKFIIIGAVIVIAAVGVVVFTNNKKPSMDMSSTVNAASKHSPGPNEVAIQNFSFGPATLKIKKGTQVTWTNYDDAHHDITPTGGANDFIASKLLAKGESYTFTFNSAGTYTYKCSPHPYMKGTIEVTE